MKLRPVDILKQLLKDSRGQDTEALRTFFHIQKEDQACATALILASLESDGNKDVAEFASRIFFLYGGEPKLAPKPTSNQCMYKLFYQVFYRIEPSTSKKSHSSFEILKRKCFDYQEFSKKVRE